VKRSTSGRVRLVAIGSDGDTGVLRGGDLAQVDQTDRWRRRRRAGRSGGADEGAFRTAAPAPRETTLLELPVTGRRSRCLPLVSLKPSHVVAVLVPGGVEVGS